MYQKVKAYVKEWQMLEKDDIVIAGVIPWLTCTALRENPISSLSSESMKRRHTESAPPDRRPDARSGGHASERSWKHAEEPVSRWLTTRTIMQRH